MSAYRVREGTQVYHDGKTYAGGSTVNVAPAVARLWLAYGWVTEVKATARRSKADKAD